MYIVGNETKKSDFGEANKVSLCYDFQKWTILTLALVLAVNLIGITFLISK
jgi:hypothetical protein